ncbi:hypothetical protein KIN20_016676 [Parelaphostrongylus tenuis]|uniref:Protein kinase domain-containing protein n=1 Tax=Parelaphostrongylus tenuis TaxID=148309 RepID=A0AAD5MYW5_PARTN|nr:hypothetical protein KIN20_016676 [Parelaphostrongylus tenuis]
MKVEKKTEQRRHPKLKMEIAILKLMAVQRKQAQFTRIVDRGKCDTFFFLVMQLVGKSLADLKATRPNKVYLLDFGLARKIVNVKEELKTPRESVLIKGTLRFISMACHKRIELGPKDDCESWFYLYWI